MSENEIRFVLPGVKTSETASRAAGVGTRGVSGPGSQLLAPVKVKEHFDLSPANRAASPKTRFTAQADDVLALQMEGDFILYTSAGALADDLRRIDPSSVTEDGEVRLDALRSRGPAARGLGDWFLRALSVVGIDSDAIVAAAVDKAKQWLGDQAADLVEKGTTWAGTKALTWAIEEHSGVAAPGLYRWAGEGAAGSGLQPVGANDFKDWKADDPILVFVHGTGSSTLGSFGALGEPVSMREWDALHDKFGSQIYGFEHRTFSASPIENAVELAKALPAKARLSVVTHSRGGQVGDLLCLAGLGANLIESFKRDDERLADADKDDRAKLAELDALLAQKSFRIERYARVACPARGTLLASSHLDAFLSTLLHLLGLVPYLQGPAYAAAKRIVLQIVKNRTDPRLVPGIESMLPARR